ncbi:MAG: RHS repeat-associated core domain-containing protein [Acidobacteria bacterium]|nr:RHS repeat-associated core domain-containing protein [Acidobacteriota bacterium]
MVLNLRQSNIRTESGTLVEEWTTTPPMERNGLPTVATTSYVYAGSRLISTETNAGTTYITLDHLGSTRVTTDGGGNVTSRKDFMAFGEEAITVQRNVGVGYGVPPVRQDYTGYEKEAESGLEFAQARFQNPIHGRFTSVDPLTASASIKNPQSFNRYTYALNSPYKFVDPLGLAPEGYWQTKYSNHGHCTPQAEFCGDDWNMWLDQDLDMFAAARGDVEKDLKNLKQLYGELTGNDLDTVKETVELAMEILGEKEIADAIIKEFRKEGDTLEPLDGIKSLNLDGGFKIVGEGENRAVAVIANVFDGRKSAINVVDPYDGRTKGPASIVLALRKRIGAYTLNFDKILLGSKAFGGSTMIEKVQIIIHEAVVHKLFKRRDLDFGTTQVEGSEKIRRRLTKILERSDIFRERKK